MVLKDFFDRMQQGRIENQQPSVDGFNVDGPVISEDRRWVDQIFSEFCVLRVEMESKHAAVAGLVRLIVTIKDACVEKMIATQSVQIECIVTVVDVELSAFVGSSLSHVGICQWIGIGCRQERWAVGG